MGNDAVAAAFFVFAVGCAAPCETACRKVYAPDACDLQVPGAVDGEELYADCEHECRSAMSNPDGMDDVDPNGGTGAAAVPLETREQARAFVACVAESSCDELADGSCQSI